MTAALLHGFTACRAGWRRCSLTRRHMHLLDSWCTGLVVDSTLTRVLVPGWMGAGAQRANTRRPSFTTSRSVDSRACIRVDTDHAVLIAGGGAARASSVAGGSSVVYNTKMLHEQELQRSVRRAPHACSVCVHAKSCAPAGHDDATRVGRQVLCKAEPGPRQRLCAVQKQHTRFGATCRLGDDKAVAAAAGILEAVACGCNRAGV